MRKKIAHSIADALGDVPDGSVIAIGGFGDTGIPNDLIHGLLQTNAHNLTIVSNNAGNALADLLKQGRVRKIICSFPRTQDGWVFDELYRRGQIALELVPQGSLAERIRAAGAGLGGFFTPTGYGTELAKGKETRTIDGRNYVFELPIHCDLALVKAERADLMGNLVYRMTARNFGPIMAMGARRTVASVHSIVEPGELDPESIVTPGIFVNKVVLVKRKNAGPPATRQAA